MEEFPNDVVMGSFLQTQDSGEIMVDGHFWQDLEK